MCKNKPIHADHYRNRKFLCQTESDDMQIKCFLVILGKQLYPTGIALGQGIRMIVPNIDRRTDGSICHCHNDRKFKTRRVINCLDHKQQSLRCRSCIGASTSDRRADSNGHSRKLGFDINKLARRELTFLNHLSDFFNNMSLRRNWISADHFRATKCHCFSNSS